MKKAGIGAVLGLAIFAASETAQAIPQQTQVVIPYFTSVRGMFTAVSYVATGGTQIHLVYYFKNDLTQDINNVEGCTHYNGYIETSENDMDTFIIDGNDNVRPIFSDGGPGDIGNIVAPPVNAEGFLAIEGVADANNNTANVVAEAHVVVTATRGVYSFRAIRVETDANNNINFADLDTIAPGANTTVMLYPEGIAETYIYAIADGGNLFGAADYIAASTLEVATDNNGLGVFNRAEEGRSIESSLDFTCAAIVHVRDILGDVHYNFVRNTGGWFNLGVDANAANGVVAYKIEIAPSFGATITPLTLEPYAR